MRRRLPPLAKASQCGAGLLRRGALLDDGGCCITCRCQVADCHTGHTARAGHSGVLPPVCRRRRRRRARAVVRAAVAKWPGPTGWGMGQPPRAEARGCCWVVPDCWQQTASMWGPSLLPRMPHYCRAAVQAMQDMRPDLKVRLVAAGCPWQAGGADLAEAAAAAAAAAAWVAQQVGGCSWEARKAADASVLPLVPPPAARRRSRSTAAPRAPPPSGCASTPPRASACKSCPPSRWAGGDGSGAGSACAGAARGGQAAEAAERWNGMGWVLPVPRPCS